MSVENNKRVVQRLFYEDLAQPDPVLRAPITAEVFAPDFYDATNPPGMQHGHEGHAAIVNLFHDAFSNLDWIVEDMVAEGDRVVARTTMKATHSGEFFGIPPTGREVCVGGIHMLTLRDGQVILHQGVNDDLGLMRQLGVVPG